MITDEQLEIALTAFNVYYDGSNPITSLREALASYEASKPTLPKAMKEAPEVMMLYFTPFLSPIQGYQSHLWVNTPGQLKTLAAGLCFATSDDAQTVTDAMLALVRA